jgi:hypothetical protein
MVWCRAAKGLWELQAKAMPDMLSVLSTEMSVDIVTSLGCHDYLSLALGHKVPPDENIALVVPD